MLLLPPSLYFFQGPLGEEGGGGVVHAQARGLGEDGEDGRGFPIGLGSDELVVGFVSHCWVVAAGRIGRSQGCPWLAQNPISISKRGGQGGA